MTAKKVLRAQTIALREPYPHALSGGLSGGISAVAGGCLSGSGRLWTRLPQQRGDERAGGPADHGDHGNVRRGGAYLPVMTDTVLMTEGSGLFLAGPSLVQAAIGQKTDPEELGGASMHAEISGTVDFKEPNDHLCIARLRSLVSQDRRAPAWSLQRGSVRCG